MIIIALRIAAEIYGSGSGAAFESATDNFFCYIDFDRGGS